MLRGGHKGTKALPTIACHLAFTQSAEINRAPQVSSLYERRRQSARVLRAKSISCLVTSIRVLPYFLVSGTHMEHDLPRVLHDIYLQYKGLSIIATLPLDTHPGLLPILTDGARGPQ